jgi:hypothetical protein
MSSEIEFVVIYEIELAVVVEPVFSFYFLLLRLRYVSVIAYSQKFLDNFVA